MKYTKEDLVPGFRFRHPEYGLQTIERININNWDGVKCKRTNYGLVTFKIYYLLRGLNNKEWKVLKPIKQNYEIF